MTEIELLIEWAKKYLSSAALLLKAGDYESSVSRTCYAMFYAALAYYYDHKQEIDQSMAESEVFGDAIHQRTPSLLAKKKAD